MNYTKSGCYYSKPKIYPENWKTGGKSLLKLTWRIDYTFHDPKFKKEYPNGKPVRVKGMNRAEDLDQRRALMESIYQNELDMLEFQGYNPITNTINPPPPPPADKTVDIYPEMPVMKALYAGRDKKDCTPETKANITSVLNAVNIAIIKLDYDDLPIKDIRKKHIKCILDELGVIKKEKWTNNNFNHHRSHIGMVLIELEEYDAVECNYAEQIRKRSVVKKLRSVLTEEERIVINDHIMVHHFRYWVFINLFFHSGTRRREINDLKGKDVDLKRQVYKTTVKKGGKYEEVERPIKKVAVPFWEIALRGCTTEDYIFSHDFHPGPKSQSKDVMTRWWRRIIKKTLGIEIDLYSLKHLNTDEVTEQLGIEAAARLNSHSPEVALAHYAVNEKKREMNRIKEIGNTFVANKA